MDYAGFNIRILWKQVLCFLLLVTVFHSTCGAQDSKLRQALSIKPKQADVDFDRPSKQELPDCKFSVSRNPPGFIVTDGTQRILRKFVDTDKDGKLDRWSYFKNGIEVYRDIDSDFDRRTDAYRWLGTGGTRWGLDPNQDGEIDAWKVISAEEVAFEVFRAIATSDLPRFESLLITPNELKSLDLGNQIGKEIEKRLSVAKSQFLKTCQQQKRIDGTTEWVHASFGLPAMVPAESNGVGSDIIIYDHASAVFKGKDFGQLALGSIVQVKPGLWRLIELPEIVEEGKPLANGGAFFPMPNLETPSSLAESADPGEAKLAKKYGELAEVEKNLSAAKTEKEIRELELGKAKLLEQIFHLTENAERKRDWLENIADSVASAYQSERFPDGIEFLNGFLSRLNKTGHSDGLDYIRWRTIFAKYGLATDLGNSKDREQAHERLIEDLTDFQADYKASPLSADALTQLGIHYEINGETEKSLKWYQLAVDRFPDSRFGKRSAGALSRLENEGKKVSFVGQDLRGRKFNLQDKKLRNRVVVIHFWETWCSDELEEIQRLVEKFKKEVVFVGCNIETETEKFKTFLKKNPDFTSWPHLHAPGSMEGSPLALQLGIPSEPMVFIFNGDGELVESDIPFSDLEREIERLRRK